MLDFRSRFILKHRQKYTLQSPEERDNDGKPKEPYNPDELVLIFKRSSEMGRRYLLMGLLLGWAQEGIASMRKNHLLEINGEYFIDRRRGKTGVPGFWWVAPELAAMLVKEISQTAPNTHNLAFLTEDGFPLRHGRTDSIRLTWRRNIGDFQKDKPTKFRQLPFGRVKKCGAQLVENVSGSHELAQLFLAHKVQTVAAAHYVGSDVRVGLGKSPYERLHDAQREIWKALKPPFFPTAAAKPKLAEQQDPPDHSGPVAA